MRCQGQHQGRVIRDTNEALTEAKSSGASHGSRAAQIFANVRERGFHGTLSRASEAARQRAPQKTAKTCACKLPQRHANGSDHLKVIIITIVIPSHWSSRKPDRNKMPMGSTVLKDGCHAGEMPGKAPSHLWAGIGTDVAHEEGPGDPCEQVVRRPTSLSPSLHWMVSMELCSHEVTNAGTDAHCNLVYNSEN